MHKRAIKHKQAIIGGGYLFTENACFKSNAWFQDTTFGFVMKLRHCHISITASITPQFGGNIKITPKNKRKKIQLYMPFKYKLKWCSKKVVVINSNMSKHFNINTILPNRAICSGPSLARCCVMQWRHCTLTSSSMPASWHVNIQLHHQSFFPKTLRKLEWPSEAPVCLTKLSICVFQLFFKDLNTALSNGVQLLVWLGNSPKIMLSALAIFRNSVLLCEPWPSNIRSCERAFGRKWSFNQSWPMPSLVQPESLTLNLAPWIGEVGSVQDSRSKPWSFFVVLPRTMK